MKNYAFDIKELYLNYYFQKHPLKFSNGFSEESLSMIENSEELKNLSALLKKTHFNDNKESLTNKIDLLNNFIIDLDNLINKKITLRKASLFDGENIVFTVNNFLFTLDKNCLEGANIVSYDYMYDNFSLELASESFFEVKEASFYIVDKSKIDSKHDSQAISAFRNVFGDIQNYIKKEYDNPINNNFLNSLFKNLLQYSDGYLSLFSITDVKEVNFQDTQKLFNDLSFYNDLVALSSDSDLKLCIEGLKNIDSLIINNPIKNKKVIK